MATSTRRSRDQVRAHRDRSRRQELREIRERRIFAVRPPARLQRKTSRPAPIGCSSVRPRGSVEHRFADRYSPAARLADASHLAHQCRHPDASFTAGHYRVSHVPQVQRSRSAFLSHSDSRAPLRNPLFFPPDRPAAGFFPPNRASCPAPPASPRNGLICGRKSPDATLLSHLRAPAVPCDASRRERLAMPECSSW
jgi:hypothetical protein